MWKIDSWLSTRCWWELVLTYSSSMTPVRCILYWPPDFLSRTKFQNDALPWCYEGAHDFSRPDIASAAAGEGKYKIQAQRPKNPNSVWVRDTSTGHYKWDAGQQGQWSRYAQKFEFPVAFKKRMLSSSQLAHYNPQAPRGEVWKLLLSTASKSSLGYRRSFQEQGSR